MASSAADARENMDRGKIKLQALFEYQVEMAQANSPVYGEKGVTIRCRCIDLIWRPLGRLVRFVLVDHPRRGKCMLLCTDLSLTAIDIIQLYGLRSKIEVAFKAALLILGGYACHFWMRAMTPRKRGEGRRPVSTPRNARLPASHQAQDRRVSPLHPDQLHCPRYSALSRRAVSSTGMAAFRILAAHHSPQDDAIGNGNSAGVAQQPFGLLSQSGCAISFAAFLHDRVDPQYAQDRFRCG